MVATMHHKIAWHTWEPGVFFKRKTASSGGGSWMSSLFWYLLYNGIGVHWVDEDPVTPDYTLGNITSLSEVEDISLLFLCWRWEMPAYPERHRLWERQWDLIQEASKLGIPILIHDQDHKITNSEHLMLKSYDKVTIASPQFLLNGREHKADMTLMYPNFSINRPDSVDGYPREWFMTYIGNNYERYDQAKRFIEPFSNHYQASVYGNWLERGSDGRESPETVKHDFPNVSFLGRCANDKVVEILSDAYSTVHLAKESYCETGFITMRWAEAAAAGCLAFIPREFYMPPYWRSVLWRLFVEDGNQAKEVFSNITGNEFAELVETQRYFVYSLMRPEKWVYAIKEIIENDSKE